MALNFGVLPQVLFSPKKAFESISDSTNIGDGIGMYVILAVIGGILGLVITSAGIGVIVTAQGAIVNMGSWVVSIIVDVIMGILVLLAIGWLAAKLAASIGKGQENMDKTVGFLGYAAIVDLIIGILASILVIAMIGPITSASMSGNLSSMIGFAGIGLILLAVWVVWKLYVGGTAVSVANKVSLGAGIASYFLSWLIIWLIIIGVMFALLFSFLGIVGPSAFGV